MAIRPRNYVGVTGVSDASDAESLIGLFGEAGYRMVSRDYDTQTLERPIWLPKIGILACDDTLAGRPGPSKRYPTMEQVYDILLEAQDRFVTMMHYYTKELWLLDEQVSRLFNEIEYEGESHSIYHEGLCRELQLNSGWPGTKRVAAIRKEFPEMEMTLRMTPEMIGGISQPIMFEWLKHYEDYIGQLMIDLSGIENAAETIEMWLRLYEGYDTTVHDKMTETCILLHKKDQMGANRAEGEYNRAQFNRMQLDETIEREFPYLKLFGKLHDRFPSMRLGFDVGFRGMETQRLLMDFLMYRTWQFSFSIDAEERVMNEDGLDEERAREYLGACSKEIKERPFELGRREDRLFHIMDKAKKHTPVFLVANIDMEFDDGYVLGKGSAAKVVEMWPYGPVSTNEIRVKTNDGVVFTVCVSPEIKDYSFVPREKLTKEQLTDYERAKEDGVFKRRR